MTLRITALQRGGLAVYGSGFFNPKTSEAIALTREDETVAVTIEFASAPTSPSKETSGVTSTTPAISGNKLSLTLSSIQDNGYADVTATVGGEIRTVRIRAVNDTQSDRYAV